MTALQMVDVVTAEHAHAFVEKFYENATDSGAMDNAISETGIVEWPDGPIHPSTTEQDEYIALENVVMNEIMDRLREPLERIFIQAATEVLASHRSGALVLPPRGAEPEGLPAPVMDFEAGLEGGRAILGRAIARAIARGLVSASSTHEVADSNGTVTSTFRADAARVPVGGDEVYLGITAPDREAGDEWGRRRVVGRVAAVTDDGALQMEDLYSGGTVPAREIGSGLTLYFGVVVVGRKRRAAPLAKKLARKR